MKSDTQNKSPTHFKVPRRVPCKKIYADLLRPDFRVILSTQHFLRLNSKTFDYDK